MLIFLLLIWAVAGLNFLLAVRVGFPCGPGFVGLKTSPNPSNPNTSKAVCLFSLLVRFAYCGESGIRTHEGHKPLLFFENSAFNQLSHPTILIFIF